MTDDLAELYVHPVAIERLAGSGAYGDTWDTAATVTGFVDDTERLVRDAQGQEVVSSARVFLPIGTPAVPLGSKITLPAAFASRSTFVVAVSVHDAGGLPLPAHVEIHLL